MSEPQSSSRLSRRFGAAFGTALLTLGELVAVAVAVVMLALPRADRMVRPTAPIYEHCRPTGRASACSPRTCETAPHPMPNRSADPRRVRCRYHDASCHRDSVGRHKRLSRPPHYRIAEQAGAPDTIVSFLCS
jgi:hypothetical protein